MEASMRRAGRQRWGLHAGYATLIVQQRLTEEWIMLPSPFPGMDPYLEHPVRWMNFHDQLVVAIGHAIAPLVAPRYWVSVQERVYVGEPADADFIRQQDRFRRPDVTVSRVPVEAVAPALMATTVAEAEPLTVYVPVQERIRETYLEIVALPSYTVVTVIEVLSPTNKQAGEGRTEYEAKRSEILRSDTHLVEVDLLRAGQPMRIDGGPGGVGYRILISRAGQRPRAELYHFGVRDRIPSFRLPLQRGDSEPLINLGDIVGRVYEQGAFYLVCDYTTDPIPPLTPEDAAWADALLREQGRR